MKMLYVWKACMSKQALGREGGFFLEAHMKTGREAGFVFCPGRFFFSPFIFLKIVLW